MDIKINRNSETPLYLQIEGIIKAQINSMELFPGYKMPSERKLAGELNVHRNTIVKFYSDLVAEGYLISSRKTPEGYFVNSFEGSGEFTRRFFPLGKRLRYTLNRKEKLFFNLYDQSRKSKDCISMGGVVVDKDILSFDGTENFTSKIFHPEADQNERLKGNISKLLAKENIYVSPKNIQISSETNQLLSQLCELFLSEGDCIIAEEPLMPDNMALFRNKNLHVITIPMEADGMNLVILKKMIEKHHPKFIYTLPTYHNPNGITMSLEKRMQLLSIANRYDVPIIEEASERDFNYTDNKIPSLYAMDKNQSVVYINSFTLTFPYDIKIAYIVGPHDLMEMLGRYVMITETTISSLTDYVMNEILESGYYEKCVNKLVCELKKRRDLLYTELEKIRHKGIECRCPDGGLSIWCTLDKDIKEMQLVEAAREKGLIIMPGFVFYPFGDQGCGHLRLAFSNCKEEQIIKGVRILSEAIDVCRSNPK